MTNETTTIEGWELRTDSDDGVPFALTHDDAGCRCSAWIEGDTLRFRGTLRPPTSVLRWLLAKHDGQCAAPVAREAPPAEPPDCIGVMWGDEPRTLAGRECLGGCPYDQHFADEELSVYRNRETHKWWATFDIPGSTLDNLGFINSEGPFAHTPQDAVAALHNRLAAALGCEGWRERTAEGKLAAKTLASVNAQLAAQQERNQELQRLLDASKDRELKLKKLASDDEKRIMEECVSELEAPSDCELQDTPPDATGSTPITDGAEAVKRLRDAGFDVELKRLPSSSLRGVVRRVWMGTKDLCAADDSDANQPWYFDCRPRPDIRTTDDLHAALLAEIQRIVGERYGGLELEINLYDALKDGWRLGVLGTQTEWIAIEGPGSESLIGTDESFYVPINDYIWVYGPYRIVGRQWPEGDSVSDDAPEPEPTPNYPPANELDRLREQLMVGVLAGERFRHFTEEERLAFADREARALLKMRGSQNSMP